MRKKLEELLANFNAEEYIKNNPIKVVKEMQSRKPDSIGDIEICAIWTVMLHWGRPEETIRLTTELMEKTGWEPLEYVKLGEFYDIPDDMRIYKTIKGKMFKELCHNMRLLYNSHTSIQEVIAENPDTSVDELLEVLSAWCSAVKMGNPAKNSACKRLNLLLRWMVRDDDVDLGLWQTDIITPAKLYAVLDANVVKSAIKHGLLYNSKETWNAVLELTDMYKRWDQNDPLKYDLVIGTIV